LATATYNLDFLTAAGTLIFNSGETQKLVEVQLLSDSVSDPEEFFTLKLRSVTGGPTMGPTNSASIFVADAPPVSSGFNNWSVATLSSVPPAERVAVADPDHDGIPNWVEFIQGSNPVQSNSPPACRLEFNALGQAQIPLSLPDDGGFTVVAEFSPDLSWTNVYATGGAWAAPVDHLRQVLFTDSYANQPTRFIRLRYYWLEP
jgi:hypothetical protein